MAEFHPETGRSIAHYTIEKVLGRGSVGIVYLARDRRIGRRVALKHVEVDSHRFEDERDEADFFQRLQREVEVCGRLNHVNLVTLYDVGYEKDRVSYLAMELIDGPSLLDVIKSRRPQPLPLDQALDVASQILRGLAYAHGRGIVHRDIKPANVLITSDGRAKIADFGIARPDDSSMTATGTLVGTPNYMSPEQVRGITTTQRSDLFSFGAVFYEMLTGRKPFAATDVSGVLYKVVSQPHPAIVEEGLPPRLLRLVDRLLEKSPDARPESADEVLAELDAIAAEAREGRAPTSIPEEDATPEEPAAAPGSSAGREPAAEVAPAFEGATASEDLLPRDDETARSSGLTTFRRAVPARVFWGVTGGLAALLAAVVVSIAIRIDSSPTVTIPPDTLAEFAAKRDALDGAAELCSAGRFDDCIAAYDAYLERYPGSAAALAGRDEAVRLSEKGRTGEIVEVGAERTGRAAENDEPSGWQKFKKGVRRVFGRN